MGKRPYIRREWCDAFYTIIHEWDSRVRRVVTLADGGTVHNVFPDRRFRTEG